MRNLSPCGVFQPTFEDRAVAIKLGTESRVEMPIDPQSWEEGFVPGDDSMMDDTEDTPGFTLVVASAALGMALFVNQRREHNDAE